MRPGFGAMVRRGQAAVLLVILSASPSQAFDLAGEFTQGGLIQGKAPPGSTITLNGRKVLQGKDGTFVLGFGRDAKATATLVVTAPGGAPETRDLAIKKRDYDIQRIEGLPGRKVTPEKRDMTRIRAEQTLISNARTKTSLETLFRSGFIWPVKGRISGVYGSQRILNGKPRRPHNGVDIAAPQGTPIKAMADGVVVLTHEDMFFTGKTVMLNHGLGLTSLYIHMNSITVAPGELVLKGQPIGTVGMTGRATGPHLHWGVSWLGTHLDPKLLVGAMAEN